ncbi:MAG: GNAT family N-acetyltransferase [Pseudomonadota bacterium]
MATIRPATMDDIPQIVEMAKRFYPESPYPAIYGDMPEEQAAGLAIVAMQGFAESGIVPGVMLVAEQGDALVGMLCVHIDPATFTPAVIAAELVWWVEPEHRGGMTAVRLLRAGETCARTRGATVFNMAALATSPDEARMILERMGYAPTHTVYTKRL